MRRNCNLELRLSPFSDEDQQPGQTSMPNKEESIENPERQRHITIFYNGEVCVSDVTEIQARAILSLARRETEEALSTPTPTGRLSSEPASPALPLQLRKSPRAASALSMRRSLQGFLQKRKHRVQAASPYNH